MTAGPGFEVYDPGFEAVLGSSPGLTLVAETDAHEGPVRLDGGQHDTASPGLTGDA
jgi:hypothetical protein